MTLAIYSLLVLLAVLLAWWLLMRLALAGCALLEKRRKGRRG